MNLKNEKITVLAGGTSCEKEISLISGRAVYEALNAEGLESDWLDPAGCDLVSELKKQGTTVAFIALHGTFGEDGTVQRLLEEAQIRYTGPGPSASAAAFHKSRSQSICREAGILVPEFLVVRKEKFAAVYPSVLGFPLVVKPSAAGSSVGISILKNSHELAAACELAFNYSEEILLERYIPGRELTVGILGEEALPAVEVTAKRDFYDYEAKYKESGTRYECPAKLSPDEARRLSDAAQTAFKALGCEIMGRADFILGKDGQIYFLEMNTIPGLTGKSLLPKAAKAAGLDFGKLCVRILELSLKKRMLSWSGR